MLSFVDESAAAVINLKAHSLFRWDAVGLVRCTNLRVSLSVLWNILFKNRDVYRSSLNFVITLAVEQFTF